VHAIRARGCALRAETRFRVGERGADVYTFRVGAPSPHATDAADLRRRFVGSVGRWDGGEIKVERE
jgi:hypothetical protein